MSRLPKLHELVAKPLEPVKPKWRMMMDFIRSRDVVVADPGALVKIDSSGTQVTFRARLGWSPPFRVSVSNRSVSVASGFVDDRVPTIDSIGLDGRDVEGAVQPLPSLVLEDDDEPGEDGRSYICLSMLFDPERQESRIEETDWLTIRHVPDLKRDRLDAVAAEAIEPLAILYWRDESITDVKQVVMHNLKHSFVPGEPGRHFFSAV